MQTIINAIYLLSDSHSLTVFARPTLFSMSQFLASIPSMFLTQDCESSFSLIDEKTQMMLMRYSSTMSWLKGLSLPRKQHGVEGALAILRKTRYSSRSIRRLEIFNWSKILEEFILHHCQVVERFSIFCVESIEGDTEGTYRIPFDKIFLHLGTTLKKFEAYHPSRQLFTIDDFSQLRHLRRLEDLEIGDVDCLSLPNADDDDAQLPEETATKRIKQIMNEVFSAFASTLTRLVTRDSYTRREFADFSSFSCLTCLQNKNI